MRTEKRGSTCRFSRCRDLPRIAEQSVGRARENYEKMKAASEEMTDILREKTYSTNAKGAADYGSNHRGSLASNQLRFDFLSNLIIRNRYPKSQRCQPSRAQEFEVVTAQNRNFGSSLESPTETASRSEELHQNPPETSESNFCWPPGWLEQAPPARRGAVRRWRADTLLRTKAQQGGSRWATL